jgi:peptidoglycan/LPS O-acetylase OafA/YrhL
LIFAIHFSPSLRRIFSHPYAVFFGSISFPVYLIHAFLMRSVLVWVIYGMVPEGPLFLRYFLNAAAFVGYLGMVTWLSVLWRDRIDSACVLITQWVEEVVVGKKTIIGSISGLRGQEMVGNGNGVVVVVGSGSLEKEVKEMVGVKGSPV